MSQRQKLAVEREKLQAELEHFRKCLTLPQTHWPRGGHYKGYPPRWPQHADLTAPRLRPPPFSDWHPEFIFHGLVHMAPQRRIFGWLDKMNEWMDECVGERTIQWRTGSLWLVASQGLCHKPLRCANVANPPTPRDQPKYRAGVPEDQHKHTHAPAFHTLFSPLLLYSSVPASLTATSTQTILPMREQLPQEGCRQETWMLQISKQRLLASGDWFLSQWPHELLNWKCT